MAVYTLKEFGVKVKKSFSWVDKMVRAGNINHILMGGERMINEEEYERVCKEGVKKLPKVEE